MPPQIMVPISECSTKISNFESSFNVNKRLNQITLSSSGHICATCSELPSSISTLTHMNIASNI